MIVDRVGIIAREARSAISGLLRERVGRSSEPALPSFPAAVAATVESKLGCAVTVIGSKQIETTKARRKVKRTYVEHLLRAGAPVNRDLTVFTKTGRKVAYDDLERYLSGLALPEFRTPTYYGRIATVAGDTGIWERISQDRLPGSLSRDDLRRVVGAVAAMNALTADAVRHVPALPIGTSWAVPVADKLRAALATEERFMRDASVQDALERLAALEVGALARLASIGNRFFSHQDISHENVWLTPAPNPLLIVDWESAAIAAPGAGLRRFAMLDVEAQLDVAQHYVACLEAKGLPVDVDDALFVMGAVQLLAKLHMSVKRLKVTPKRARKAIRSGLMRAPFYLCRDARASTYDCRRLQ